MPRAGIADVDVHEGAVRVVATPRVSERLAERDDVFVLRSVDAEVDRASGGVHAADRGRSITGDDEQLGRSAAFAEVIGDGQKVTGLTYKDRTTDALHTVELEGIFVQIGLLPNSDWLKGTVELNRFGEIIVDAKGATNIPGVFAAGDVTTVPYKQIVIAMGEGSKASLSAFDHLIRHS